MDAHELAHLMSDLPPKLLRHLERTVHEARFFAHIHHVDEDLAALGAQAHDVVRHVEGPVLLAMAEQFGIPVGAVERAEPVLLHGPIGALVLPLRYGVTEPEVIVSTRYHTTGPRMGPIEKVVFIADKVDPKKVQKRPELTDVRDLAHHDLDAAILRYLDLEQARAVDKAWLLHPREVETRNWLLLKKLARG